MIRKQVGVVGVDAGVLMVGDPCYFFGPEITAAQQAYRGGWTEVCEELLDKQFDADRDNAAQLRFAKGHKGLGVIVHTTHGDGAYPVYLETDNKGRRRLVVDLD